MEQVRCVNVGNVTVLSSVVSKASGRVNRVGFVGSRAATRCDGDLDRLQLLPWGNELAAASCNGPHGDFFVISSSRVRSILTADRVGRKKKIQNFSRKTRLRLYYFVPSCLDFRPWLSSPAGTVPRDARIRRADSAQRNPCTRSRPWR